MILPNLPRALVAAGMATLSLTMTAAAAQAREPQAALEAALARAPDTEPAKNIILFIGDGMGVSTVTAMRILAGQRAGVDGASYDLAFDTMPYGGLVRTYSVDGLVTDSANGASAITTGHRTINGGIGVDGRARRGVCDTALNVPTLAQRAKRELGKAVGVVSTAAITDATPAAFYAHAPDRNWQSDADMPAAAREAGCVDIAAQLVMAEDDLRPDIALGGGLTFFRTEAEGGRRKDGQDLPALWSARPDSAFVTDRDSLNAAVAAGRDVLGLFAEMHIPHEVNRPTVAPQTPTLEEMTRAAITRLASEPQGYVLLIEAAHIDKAHHAGLLNASLTEGVELSKAVAVAQDLTDPADTLIIVTADHSHGLVLNGGGRGDDVLGLIKGPTGAPRLAEDGKPLPILTYATGPGGPKADEGRPTLEGVDVTAIDHIRQAGARLGSAAHTGEDVPAYADGPGAYLVTGSMDQPYLFQVMRHALRLPVEAP
ncbi:alkaline phosphatase [Phenylobacterium sp.]|uniref:alkaline phosphatase n=1 Tax=Phenylobacterium sp. TaxID=1871053 RepID=UPI002730A5AD|nr:alkaline phosphatase [Phenylobacterium sp.]MDP1616749.1 alkaline phosphatase [Phenylobacterium sp.]MDP1988305.1 alkaline phosphatase [Phenylobacterium sp.]